MTCRDHAGSASEWVLVSFVLVDAGMQKAAQGSGRLQDSALRDTSLDTNYSVVIPSSTVDSSNPNVGL